LPLSFVTLHLDKRLPKNQDKIFLEFFDKQLHLVYDRDLKSNFWRSISQEEKKRVKSHYSHFKETAKSYILIAGMCPKEKPMLSGPAEKWLAHLKHIIEVVHEAWPSVMIKRGLSPQTNMNQGTVHATGKWLTQTGHPLPRETPAAIHNLLEACLSGPKRKSKDE